MTEGFAMYYQDSLNMGKNIETDNAVSCWIMPDADGLLVWSLHWRWVEKWHKSCLRCEHNSFGWKEEEDCVECKVSDDK